MAIVQNHQGRETKGRSRSVLLSVFIGLVICGIVLWFLKPNEPRFDGKPLSYWLAALDTGKFDVVDFNPVLNPEAVNAVQQIGKPAVPFLIDRIKSALAAERTFYRLQDWPTKLPFRLMEDRLDRRMTLGREGVFGFVILGTIAKDALPQLEAMIPGQEVQSRAVLHAIASTGPTSLVVLSNALQNSDYWLPGHAASAVGLLGKEGVPLVPQLVSMLDDPKHERTSPFIVRSLGRIGEPRQTVVSALRRCLLSTNDSLAGNAALGLMFMGDAAQEALPDIEARLVSREGKVNAFAVLSLIVLSTNDDQLTASLERTRSLRVPDDTEKAAADVRRNQPGEMYAQVRNTWTNCDAQGRRELFANIKALIPVNRTN